MIIDNLYSVPIATVIVEEEIIDNTLSKLKTFISNPDNKKYIDNMISEGAVVTTYYSDPDHNLLGKMEDAPLLTIINEEARKFLEVLGIDPNCYVEITSWMQINPPGSLFNKHEHYGAFLSGVIYLDVADNCGDLTFYNPIALRTQTLAFVDNSIKKNNNFYNFETVKFVPKKGKMIIFESFLSHGVGVNLSNTDRYAISFNVWVNKHGKS